jgi:kynurenine formamidase
VIFGVEATRWPIEHRSIGALGIDTLGIDPCADTSFRANRLLLGQHRIHLENLAGLGEMPPAGGWIIVGGIRIRAGSSSPATVFGPIP